MAVMKRALLALLLACVVLGCTGRQLQDDSNKMDGKFRWWPKTFVIQGNNNEQFQFGKIIQANKAVGKDNVLVNAAALNQEQDLNNFVFLKPGDKKPVFVIQGNGNDQSQFAKIEQLNKAWGYGNIGVNAAAINQDQKIKNVVVVKPTDGKKPTVVFQGSGNDQDQKATIFQANKLWGNGNIGLNAAAISQDQKITNLAFTKGGVLVQGNGNDQEQDAKIVQVNALAGNNNRASNIASISQSQELKNVAVGGGKVVQGNENDQSQKAQILQVNAVAGNNNEAKNDARIDQTQKIENVAVVPPGGKVVQGNENNQEQVAKVDQINVAAGDNNKLVNTAEVNQKSSIDNTVLGK